MKAARHRWLLGLTVVIVFLAVVILTRRETGRLKLPTGNVLPQISIGHYHGLILAGDGSMWAWGGYGRGWPVLGLGTIRGTTQLQRIGSETNWLCVSAGGDHSLALKTDGSIWAWGSGGHGAFGDGNVQGKLTNGALNLQYVPVRSVAGNDWKHVAAGNSCSFALKKDGTLWAWGLNNSGQLGIDSTVFVIAQATQVGTATNWVKVRTGGLSSGGIQSDGSLWIWGLSPKFGDSSKNNSQDVLSPVRISPDTNWVDLSVAYNFWIGIKSDGTLWAWGQRAHIVTGAPDSGEFPTQIGTNTDWQSVSSELAGNFYLLRKRDNSFRIMTTPSYGALSFKYVDFPKDAVAFDGSGGAFAVLTGNGEVWACGNVLGEQTAKDKTWDFLGKNLYRFGIQIPFHHRGTIEREKPWQLRNVEPINSKTN